MCTPFFNPSAAKVSEYHVHIYYDAANEYQAWLAKELAARLLQRFPGKVTGGDVIGRIGPHTQENVEVDVTPDAFGDVVRFIQLNSQGLSVLIHPRTGDEVFDHGHTALWLGAPLPFNQAFFDRVQAAQDRAMQRQIDQRLKQAGLKPPKR